MDEREPGPEGERRSGIFIETCYRHADVVTGVHCTRCQRPICTECMVPAAVGYQCPDCARQARQSGTRLRLRVRFTVGRAGAATSLLILAIVGMFLVEFATGASRGIGFTGDAEKLLQLGANWPPSIAAGHQYWRFLTATFLHLGLLHLAFNMYALYLFGTLVEEALGSWRFLAVYLLSGVMASVASFAFGPIALSAGASGSIFGVLGAWVAYNYRRRSMRYNRANLQGAYLLIAINLVLGFSGVLPVDNFAHVGGLVTGAAIAGILEAGRASPLRSYLRAGGLALVAIIGVALTAWRLTTFPRFGP